MALENTALKTVQLTATSPTYEFYGNKYDMNSLRKRVWDEFDSYVSGLKYGDKRRVELEDSTRKILNGLADGTIVFDINNNEFVDSRLKLTNIGTDRNKDYVGLSANLIYKNMDLADKYEDPADKKKIQWDGLNTINTIISRALFNSDSPTEEHLKGYIDRDFVNDGKRSLENRGKFNYSLLSPLATREWWDANIKGFTDDDFNKWAPIITQAAGVWNDTSMDAGDLAALVSLSSSTPWGRMGYTGLGYSSEADELARLQAEALAAAALANDPYALLRLLILAEWDKFVSWLNTKYPRTKKALGKMLSLNSDKRYGDWTDNLLLAALATMSNDELLKTFHHFFASSNYSLGHNLKVKDYFSKLGKTIQTNTFDKLYSMNSLLRAMENRPGMLLPVSNKLSKLYHIPGLDHDLIGTVWDSVGKELRQIALHDLPYWLDKVMKEYMQENLTGISNDDLYSAFRQYFIPTLKKGGVLKALRGSLLDVISYTDEDLAKNRRLRNKYKDDNTFEELIFRGDYGSKDEIYPGNGLYDPEKGGRHLEKQQYYLDFIKLLTNKRNENLAKAWAIRYAELNGNTGRHHLKWFNKINPDGTIDYESFDWDKFVNTFTNAAATKRVFEDGINGIGHDIYRGRVYQLVDENGNPIDENGNPDDLYLDSEGLFDENGLLLSDYEWYKDSETNPELHNSNLAYIYKIRKKANPAEAAITPDGTENPNGEVVGEIAGADIEDENTRFRKTTGDGKREPIDLGKFNIDGLWFDVAEWARRRLGNKDNEKLLLLDYITYDPEYRQSPLYWDWHSDSNGRRRGAEMMARISKPVTSNANKAINLLFEGYRQYNLLYVQPAERADHAMGAKTLEKLIENNNYTNHSLWETALKNKKIIWDIDNYNKQIHAYRTLYDTENDIGLINAIKSSVTGKAEEDKAMRKAAAVDMLSQDYQNALYSLDEKYATWYKLKYLKDPTDSDKLADPKYRQALLDIIALSKYNINTYDYDNSDPYKGFKSKTYADIISSYFAKKGGTLVPKTKRFK